MSAISLSREAKTRLGVRLDSDQLMAFEQYQRALLEWNQRVNLTAIRTPEEIRVKHFLDSLTCLKAMNETSMRRVVDVGTGAGFPGLPLKIAHPEIQLTLVESVEKRASFCRHIVEALGLEDVEVITARAEDVGQMMTYRERFDWALARAVASLPVLAEYLLPLIRVGGRMLAQRGGGALGEAKTAARAIQILGGKLDQVKAITLPSVVEARHIVVVEKVSSTPDRYPRRVGVPMKRPLS